MKLTLAGFVPLICYPGFPGPPAPGCCTWRPPPPPPELPGPAPGPRSGSQDSWDKMIVSPNAQWAVRADNFRYMSPGMIPPTAPRLFSEGRPFQMWLGG